MSQSIAYVSVLVRDYDEAIAYYTGCLGFTLVEDTPRPDGKRWVLVAPPGARECFLLLAQARKPDELEAIGHQAGGRVFLFLHTDNFERDYQALAKRGVQFCEQPRKESYGTVAVFVDLYGNRWDLLQLHPMPNAAAGPNNASVGGCLCGGLRYELGEAPRGVADCHCLDCRRSSGAAYVTWGVVRRKQFRIVSGTLRWVNHAGRRRGFAACCGTPVVFEDAPGFPSIDVAIATLDDPTPFPPRRAIWTEDKLPWVMLDPALPASATIPAKSPGQ